MISLGDNCQVAYQINRHNNEEGKLFFDWLITNNQDYKSILLDPEQFFLEKNISVSDNKLKVIDGYTGIQYLHEFPINEETKKIDEDKVLDHLNTARSKFKYLQEKTIKAISDSEHPYLIRRLGYKDANLASEVAQDIHNTFKHLNKNLKVVITCGGITEDVIQDDTLLLFVQGTAEWNGDDKSWDKAFDKIKLHFKNILYKN